MPGQDCPQSATINRELPRIAPHATLDPSSPGIEEVPMARMSREFSLVLLGAGILTAGYFLWPEEDVEAKANQQAQQQIVGNNGHRSGYPHLLIWHSVTPGARMGSPSIAGISREGFGGIGHSASPLG
jgi:hypothetical protein